jgi:hypothetical protein
MGRLSLQERIHTHHTRKHLVYNLVFSAFLRGTRPRSNSRRGGLDVSLRRRLPRFEKKQCLPSSPINLRSANRSRANGAPKAARARVATARTTVSLLQVVTSTSLTPEQCSATYCRMSSIPPALMLWQPLRLTNLKGSPRSRQRARDAQLRQSQTPQTRSG